MSIRGRLFPCIATAVLTCSIVVFATPNDKGSNSEIKFTSRTSLVLIAALVTDKSGRHIAGLKKEDFTVFENGVEQKIASFEEINSDLHRLSHRKEPGEFSNSLAGDAPSARITLIVLDLLNTPFAAQADARKDLLKYLTQSVDQREPTALYTLTRNGIQTVHDFTTDPRVLVAALHKLKGDEDHMVDTPEVVEAMTGTATPEGSAGQNPGIAARIGSGADGVDQGAVKSEFQRLQTMLSQDAELNFQAFQQRLAITYTLQGMQQLAQALAGVPGRKSLIWASGGFPFTVSGDTMYLAPLARDSLSDVLPMYEHTWQLLNAAQIALYPVDVKGLQVVTIAPASIRRPGRNYGQNASLRQMDTHATFNIFATMTGGRAYYDSNDLVKGFRDAVNDSAEYYMLGYYLDQSKTQAGWRKLTVKVKRDHLEVRARSGFFVTNATVDPENSRNSDLAIALQSPLDYTSLPLVMHWDKIESTNDPGKKLVSYQIRLEPDPELIGEADNNHIVLDFVAQPQTPDGKDVGHPVGQRIDAHPGEEKLPVIHRNGIIYAGALELSPGEYAVHFVVRDDLSGRLGSVTAPLKVE
jgi:VWFA-related protein